jgi:hypothetical protein
MAYVGRTSVSVSTKQTTTRNNAEASQKSSSLFKAVSAKYCVRISDELYWTSTQRRLHAKRPVYSEKGQRLRQSADVGVWPINNRGAASSVLRRVTFVAIHLARGRCKITAAFENMCKLIHIVVHLFILIPCIQTSIFYITHSRPHLPGPQGCSSVPQFVFLCQAATKCAAVVLTADLLIPKVQVLLYTSTSIIVGGNRVHLVHCMFQNKDNMEKG